MAPNSLEARGGLEELRFGVSPGTLNEEVDDADADPASDCVELGVDSTDSLPLCSGCESTFEGVQEGEEVVAFEITRLYPTPAGRGGNMISAGSGCCTQLS